MFRYSSRKVLSRQRRTAIPVWKYLIDKILKAQSVLIQHVHHSTGVNKIQLVRAFAAAATPLQFRAVTTLLHHPQHFKYEAGNILQSKAFRQRCCLSISIQLQQILHLPSQSGCEICTDSASKYYNFAEEMLILLKIHFYCGNRL